MEHNGLQITLKIPISIVWEKKDFEDIPEEWDNMQLTIKTGDIKTLIEQWFVEHIGDIYSSDIIGEHLKNTPVEQLDINITEFKTYSDEKS